MKKIRYRTKLDLFKNDVRKEEKGVQDHQPKNQSLSNTGELDKQLDKNIEHIKSLFGKSEDVKYREIEVVTSKKHRVFLCFIDGLVNESYINLHIIKSLMEPDYTIGSPQLVKEESSDFLKVIESRIVSSLNVKEVRNWKTTTDSILLGETLLLIDGFETGLLVSTQGFAARNVGEPDTESSVRGPREGFNEVLKVNTSLIRRKINNPNLIFEGMKLGKQTKTNIRIGYIDGIANPKVVDEVKKRLKTIDTDSILESGYIEQFIEDHPYSIFPTVANSEKPDKVAAKLLEGRVAILCDGTPFVLTVPHLFVENLQVGEDYYSRPYLSSFIRLLRLLSLFLTVASPSIYIALTTYHHEMVPALLLTTMAAAQEKVPFPTFIEALLMAIVFEILREAGVRMPRPVGAAISIVGALVIGEAAVQAGFVSAPMVIVIAITGICGFVVSSLSDAIILSRFLLIFLAGALGLYGILMGFLMLLGHLCSLRSFGSPFLSPQAPINWNGWRDSIIRMPLWFQKTRPHSVVWRESKRQGNQNKPTRPDTEGEEMS